MSPFVLPAVISLQFWFLFINLLLLGLAFSISETIQELDCLTKFYNWEKHTKMEPASNNTYVGDATLFDKHYALKISVMKPRYMAC